MAKKIEVINEVLSHVQRLRDMTFTNEQTVEIYNLFNDSDIEYLTDILGNIRNLTKEELSVIPHNSRELIDLKTRIFRENQN